MASYLRLPLSPELSYVRGDSFPELVLTFTDDAGDPISLTGARVRMSWRSKFDKSIVRILDSQKNEIQIIDNLIRINSFINSTKAGEYDFDIEINDGEVWTPIIGDIFITDDVTK